jgi:hypothetical protein
MSDLVERLRTVESSGTRQPTTNWYRNPDGVEAADEIERLRAERDRLAKDAERYRWLRHGILVTEIPDIATMRASSLPIDDDEEVYSWEVDAAIDAAMQEKRDE